MKGEYESVKFDLNATVSPLLPPIWPTGQFKMEFQLIDAVLNDTILKAFLEVIYKQTKAYRALDFNF